jgi:hypothetical protein
MDDRMLDPLDVRGSMFFCEGISNGGIFWKLNCKIDLVVGKQVLFSPMQEYCRSLQILKPISYGCEPLAIFSLPVDGTSLREPLANRRFNRGRQAVFSKLLAHHRDRIVERALALAHDKKGQAEMLALGLADSGTSVPFQHAVGTRGMLASRLKGFAKRLFIADPLQSYWSERGSQFILSVNS